MLPPIGALACLWAYFELGGTHVSGTVAATFVVTSAGCGGVFGFSIISEVETVDLDTFALSKAAKRAAHVLGGGEGEMKKGVIKRAKLGLILALPILFNLAVLLVLVVGVLTLFQLYEGVGWKIFVTALALGIKITGNKAMLGLLGGIPMWASDAQLYSYEYSTALIVRIL